jgi:N utilization substance protein A
VAKALSPAKVKEVRIDEELGIADVIVPDTQLSLAIGREGQNARLGARLTGWQVNIKSETQLAEEESYASGDWAEGEWVVDPESGEQVWVPAEGGEAISAEVWAAGGDDADAGGGEGDDERSSDAGPDAAAEVVDAPVEAASPADDGAVSDVAAPSEPAPE